MGFSGGGGVRGPFGEINLPLVIPQSKLRRECRKGAHVSRFLGNFQSINFGGVSKIILKCFSSLSCEFSLTQSRAVQALGCVFEQAQMQ